MRQLGQSGVWELFVPGVGSGTGYKYVVLGADGQWREKADPMASYAEPPADTASKVFESDLRVERRGVDDGPARQAARLRADVGLRDAPRRRGGAARAGTSWPTSCPAYLADLGFTHVELMPVMQHPFGGSWGYHVTSYFAPDSRFGDPDGFRLLVDRLHQAGIGVILDWVPGHFATDEWALPEFDGTPLYEDPNPQRGWHKEWGSHIFNFGRHEVRNFLYANALYWLEEFHADGLRVDGVASMLYLDYSREEGEWTPNKYGGRENLEAVQFLQEMNATVYKRVPGAITIAEESTSWPQVTGPTSSGGLGFGFKWNMGWMHDSLGYVQHDPVHRAYHHHEMTFSLVYAWSENYVLPISHDEVVHGKGSLLRKMPGDRWRQLANLRAYLGLHVGAPRQAAAVHGRRARPGVGVGRGPRARLVAARPPRAPRRALAGARPQPRLRRVARAVAARRRARTASSGSTPTTPAATSSRSSGAARPARPDLAVRRELLRGPARGLPARPAVGRRVGRGAQHRRRGYTGSGVGNLGGGRRRRRRPPRPAGVRRHRRAAAGDGVVPSPLGLSLRSPRTGEG